MVGSVLSATVANRWFVARRGLVLVPERRAVFGSLTAIVLAGAIAGTFILVSLALGWFVSPWWLLFTAFVGANLLQSAFTNWCPMMTLLRRNPKWWGDAEGRREGNVDEIVFTPVKEGNTRMSALLAGHLTQLARVPEVTGYLLVAHDSGWYDSLIGGMAQGRDFSASTEHLRSTLYHDEGASGLSFVDLAAGRAGAHAGKKAAPGEAIDITSWWHPAITSIGGNPIGPGVYTVRAAVVADERVVRSGGFEIQVIE